MRESEEVGVALKLLRERAGLTQQELADRLEVQQPAVARWEAGGVRIPINRIEQIVAEFGYALEYDLKAVPIGDALRDGVPVRLISQRARRPEVSTETSRVTSGEHDFAVNHQVPWQIDMWEAVSGRALPGAVAVLQAPIQAMVPHPDGVLIRDTKTIGKITRNGKRRSDGTVVFAYSLANRRDLELAGVASDSSWTQVQ
jgi:transcriptional regulator with XRE-family HTH domain